MRPIVRACCPTRCSAANERTFLHWMNTSVTIGGIAAALSGELGTRRASAGQVRSAAFSGSCSRGGPPIKPLFHSATIHRCCRARAPALGGRFRGASHHHAGDLLDDAWHRHRHGYLGRLQLPKASCVPRVSGRSHLRTCRSARDAGWSAARQRPCAHCLVSLPVLNPQSQDGRAL